MRAILVAILLILTAVSAGAGLPADATRRKEAGNQYLKQREYEAARAEYLAALKLAPEYADVHYNLGVVYFFRLKDYPRALYHFVRYARLKPDASDLGQVRSLTIQALEKIEAAEREVYAGTLGVGTSEALESFRRTHPQSPYAEDAGRQLRLLEEYDREVLRREQATREAYERAVARATPEEMNRFLREHPGAPQTTEATRLRDLWAGQRAADEKVFLAAVKASDAAALEAFLAERPQSAYAPEARKQLQQLRGADEAFQLAAAANSVPALERFLSSYGDSHRAPEARELLDALRAEQDATAAQAASAAAALAAGDRAWKEATDADDAAGYQAFLAEHPGHARAPDAGDRLADLEHRAEADRVWQVVADEHQAAAYRDFAVAYPDHPNAAEAGRRAGAIDETAAAEAARAASDQAWENAAREDTVAAYEAFLASHPDHPKADQARAEVKDIRSEAEAAAAQAAWQEADDAWNTANRADTVAAYETFLATHPDHEQAPRARKEIARLHAEAEAAAARKAADNAWMTADRAGTAAAYETFLAEHPDHPKAEQARGEVSRLRAEAEEAVTRAARQEADDAWKSADRAGTVVAYEAFLAAHPNHSKASQARKEIAGLHEEAAEAEARAARKMADAAWKAADREGTVAAYQGFLAVHPEHPKADRARREIATLERKAAEAKADAAWQAAEGANTVSGYREFLAAHPDHRRAGRAERNIRKLEEMAAEEAEAAAREVADRAWKDAERADTLGGYQEFLAAHPDHSRAGKARKRIDTLEEEAAEAAAEEAIRAAADRAWAAAEGKDTVAGYEAFYGAHPDHPRADEARRRAAAMAAAITRTPVAEPPTPERPAADAASAAWSKARDEDTIAAYDGFLRDHPDAEEAAAARSRLSELKETTSGGQLTRSRRRALDRYRRMLVDE